MIDSIDPTGHIHALPLASGPTHPTGSRQNRTLSNASSTHPHPGRSSSASVSASATGAPGTMPATPRLEDIALHRQELEEAKRENDRLKRKVLELEALLRARRGSSNSQSANMAEV